MQISSSLSSLRFGALVPIKATREQDPDGTFEQSEDGFGRVYTGHDIETEMLSRTPNGQALFRQLQAFDPALKDDEPVMLLPDYRNAKAPEAYFVTGKKDVDAAWKSYREALQAQLDTNISQQEKSKALPYFKNSEVHISTDQAQSHAVDELTKTTTLTSPVCLVEQFSISANSPLYDKTFHIISYNA